MYNYLKIYFFHFGKGYLELFIPFLLIFFVLGFFSNMYIPKKNIFFVYTYFFSRNVLFVCEFFY